MPWFRRSGSYDTSQPLPPPDSSPEGPDLGPLNEAEQGWVASHVAGLADFGVDVDDLAALGAFYDEQLRQWLATSASERPDPTTWSTGSAWGWASTSDGAPT